MTKIYEVLTKDIEGRSVIRREYFEDEVDAKLFAFGPSMVKQPSNTNEVQPIKVWKLKEYSEEKVLRQKALAKLTDAEVAALGLSRD